jgi:RNA polymerase sigma factor (sigma-70 family)
MKSLIRKAQLGCPQARAQLAAALRPRLCSMARYYSRRGNLEYEDLLQEAWCAVFEALPETKLHIGEPEQFLLRRARWAVLDYLKWSLRRQMAPLDETFTGASTGSPAGEVDLRVTLGGVAEDLSPVQRQVMEMLMAGDSCTSAADKLGCTTANVSYHLAQVRRAVDKAFREVPRYERVPA